MHNDSEGEDGQRVGSQQDRIGRIPGERDHLGHLPGDRGVLVDIFTINSDEPFLEPESTMEHRARKTKRPCRTHCVDKKRPRKLTGHDTPNSDNSDDADFEFKPKRLEGTSERFNAGRTQNQRASAAKKRSAHTTTPQKSSSPFRTVPKPSGGDGNKDIDAAKGRK